MILILHSPPSFYIIISKHFRAFKISVPLYASNANKKFRQYGINAAKTVKHFDIFMNMCYNFIALRIFRKYHPAHLRHIKRRNPP